MRIRQEGYKQTRINWEAFSMRWTFTHKPPGGLGRFGGGWNWELGFQIGSETVIINLLVCSLRIGPLAPNSYRYWDAARPLRLS